MIAKGQVLRSMLSTAAAVAPGLLWFASGGSGPAAVVTVLGGFIGFCLSLPGVSATRIARGTFWTIVVYNAPWMSHRLSEESLGGPDKPDDLPFPMPESDRAYSSNASEGESFAVVAPKAGTTEQDLRKIGLALHTWKSEHHFVRDILGLEAMLEGRLPESLSAELGLPILFESWSGEATEGSSRTPVLREYDNVALISVDTAAATQRTFDELGIALKHLPVEVYSPDYYTYLNR
jgi:hypothetical protein